MSDWRKLSKEEYQGRLTESVITAKTTKALFDDLVQYGRIVVGANVKFSNLRIDGSKVSFDVACTEAFGIVCVKCGRRLVMDTMPNPKTREKFLCNMCLGDKDGTRAALNVAQRGKCYIPGCEYRQLERGTMHLHRVVPGREGGGYTPDNCVLVCPSHHRQIEGLGWEQLHSMLGK